MYKQEFLPTPLAIKVSKALSNHGKPTEDRVLIVSPKEVSSTDSGLIIPSTVKEGVPRKGTLVQIGHLSEPYAYYEEHLAIGQVVTYGLYAGKELNLNLSAIIRDKILLEILDRYIFTVLAVNELIYIESNPHN